MQQSKDLNKNSSNEKVMVFKSYIMYGLDILRNDRYCLTFENENYQSEPLDVREQKVNS
jgi:hypothetical protein